MYAYPIYPERNTQSLDGIWDFSFLGSDAPKLESVNPKGIACCLNCPKTDGTRTAREDTL